MDISNVTRQGRKLLKLKYCGAVIVAAGTASRMGGIDKIMEPLDGEPMVMRSVRTFADCDAIKEIVVVTRQDLVVPIMSLCAGIEKVKAVVAGGSSRPESVNAGLNALSDKAFADKTGNIRSQNSRSHNRHEQRHRGQQNTEEPSVVPPDQKKY